MDFVKENGELCTVTETISKAGVFIRDHGQPDSCGCFFPNASIAIDFGSDLPDAQRLVTNYGDYSLIDVIELMPLFANSEMATTAADVA